jgi:transposase
MHTTEAELAAYIGIDWGDKTHAIALLPARGAQEEHGELAHTPEAIDAWATQLRKRFGGRRVAVILEQSKGALIYALMKYDFLVLYPVNPKQVAYFREVLAPGGNKDDPFDAHTALRLLVSHGDCLRAWTPDDARTRLIGILCEDRRRLVEQRTRLSNQLQSRLKQVFPLALEVLGSLTTDLAAAFLSRWSSFDELRQAAADDVAALYRAHGLGRAKIEERLQRIATAVPLVVAAVGGAGGAAARVRPATCRAHAATPGCGHLSIVSRRRRRAGSAIAGRVRHRPRPSARGPRDAGYQRDFAGHAPQRTHDERSPPVGVQQVPAADVSGIRPALARQIGMGQSVLQHATPARQETSRRGSRPGLQVDSGPVPLLEGTHAIRRTRVLRATPPKRFTAVRPHDNLHLKANENRLQNHITA